MSEVHYLFSLTIKDKSIQIGGDKIYVETQVEKWLPLFGDDLPPSLKGESAQAKADASAMENTSQSRRLPTVVDFIKTKGPKTVSDLVLVVGLYLERFQGKNLFTCTDLMTTIFERANKSKEEVQQALVFLSSHEPPYLNTMQTMGASEDSYSLTFSGEQVVKDGFDNPEPAKS